MRASKHALIIVDVQNDFLPGGALPVPHGDAVLKPINDLLRRYPLGGTYDLVVTTQDWHPSGHHSFQPSGPWPVHCVSNTEGAELSPHLRIDPATHFNVCKGYGNGDGYSGFDGTTLKALLLGRGITHVDVVGLALDYCVKATAIDSAHAGFQTSVYLLATRPVDPVHGTLAAIDMATAGVNVLFS